MSSKLSQKSKEHLSQLERIKLAIAKNPKKPLTVIMQELKLDYKTHRSLMVNNAKYKKAINYAKSKRGSRAIQITESKKMLENSKKSFEDVLARGKERHTKTNGIEIN